MKWGIAIVAVIIAGATYYFWQESHFDADGAAQKNVTGNRVETETKARMSEKDPEKVIPPGTIMEDGTI